MAADIPSRRRRRTEDNAGGSLKDKDTRNARFEDGTDFIPLDDTDSDDEDRHPRRRDNRSRSRSPSRDLDSRRTEIQNEPRTREWDRGKRKYDMVFDVDDVPQQPKRLRADPIKSRLTPWVDQVDWERCRTPAEMFHREVESFVDWISPTPQEDEIRGLVVAIISRAVTSQFPDAEVLPFGSYATKLYLPLGDIDLVIRSRSMAYSSTHAVLQALAATIKRSGITNKVTVIAKAKVPIVKFVTSAEYGRFNVDLSINQDNGLVAGNIINGFLRDFGTAGSDSCRALRALVLLTKLFLSQRGMNEVYTGGLGSYAIVCLCISFLQMHPKIRCGQIDPDRNLGVLVIEFFELYGTRFHYDEVGISLRNGGSYFAKRQRGWGWGERWGGSRKSSVLSIEDPGDPSNDISSGSYNFRTVRQNLAGAHNILTATMYLRAGILDSRRNGQSMRFRDSYEPTDMSILSSVIGLTQETLNNRALVKEVYESGTLHKLIGLPPPPPPITTAMPGQSQVNDVDNANGNTKKRKKKSGKEGGKGSRPRTPVVVVDGSGTARPQQNGHGKPASRSQPQSRAASVQKVWTPADEDEATSELEDVRRGRRGEAEEEGRYAIGNGTRSPPRKRRKKGHLEGEVVTFTADSDDSDSSADERAAGRVRNRTKGGVNGVNDKGKEGPPDGGSLRIKGMGSRSSSSSSLDPTAKRDYWLSKGIGPGLGENSSGSSDL